MNKKSKIKKLFTLELIFTLLFSFIVVTVQAAATPSISFSYSSTQNRLTIVSTESGYHYSSNSTTPAGANLIFVKENTFVGENTTYYVLENLTIGLSGALETKEIQTGDSIFGFSSGSYSIIWRPTGSVLWSFIVPIRETPSISFSYNSVQKTIAITTAASGYQYSRSMSSTDANLIFVKDNITYYVLSSLAVGTSGTLSTKEIQSGDIISGFSPGTYSIIWKSTGYTFMSFTITIEGTPSITFSYSSVQNRLTIVAADPGYHYSNSNSSVGANLVFVKDNVSYYVLSGLSIGTSGLLSTKEIQAGDQCTGFPQGTFFIIWKPTLTTLDSFVVSGGGQTPSISFSYSSVQQRLTISASDPGYLYSSSTSPTGANLIFVKNNQTYYVLSNLTIGLSGVLSTKMIQAGDVISGFSAGTYSIIWKPTWSIIGSFDVSGSGGQQTPNIQFSYNDLNANKQLRITATDPGIYYSKSIYSTDANLIFVRNDGTTYFVTANHTVSASGSSSLSTQEIQSGDVIYGFICGTYSMIWKPTGSVIGTFTVTPDITFSYLEQQNKVLIVSVLNECRYSESGLISSANLIFIKNDITFYISDNFTLCSSGVLANAKIQSGDTIYGFAPGQYSMFWKPTMKEYGSFTVPGESSGTEQIPSLIFVKNDQQKTLMVVSVNPSTIQWGDIQNIGNGSCRKPDSGVVKSGDTIADCSRVITLKHLPTNTLLGSFEFSATLSNFSYGGIYGTVVGNIDGSTMLLENVKIFVRSESAQSADVQGTFLAAYTDRNGNYVIKSMEPDRYQVQASFPGYRSSSMTVEVSLNQWVEVNFVLTKILGSLNQTYDSNETRLIDAIKNGFVGGELTIRHDNETNTFTHNITIYNGMEFKTVDIKEGTVSFSVAGEGSGKIVVIDITDNSVIDTNGKIVVKFDDVEINMANSVSDILNPNGDVFPKYAIVTTQAGTQLLLWVPHFSEHTITITSLAQVVDALGGPTAVLLYIVFCIAIAVAAVVHMRYTWRR